MVARTERLTRPPAGAGTGYTTRHRGWGYGLAIVGVMLVVVTLIANIVAGNLLDSDPTAAAETLAWSFGITTLGFGTVKFAIGVILIGILVRLWLRVQAVKETLPLLKAAGDDSTPAIGGDVDTPFGRAITSRVAPGPLPVHEMARTMWAPMLAMGAMLVVAGAVLSIIWAATVAEGSPRTIAALGAWTQGLQFLGEGMLLSGIAFLLGSILASLREGGGQVQEALGLTVATLKMPATAKAFVGLLMLGLMVAVAQFILYLVASGADTPQSFAAWQAWLGPFRELGIGLILAGIVMALVTIGNVLGFQFDRIRQIIATGR